jgi:integrase
VGKLTALAVKNAKPGRYADGDGLYLLVMPSGTKSWVLRVQVGGVRRDYGLGSALVDGRGLISIAEAREKAQQWRKLAKAGIDPAHAQRRLKDQQTTFQAAASLFHEERKGSWKNEKHRDQWINTVETYAYPSLGRLSVDQIDANDIAQALLPIWTTKGETARRVRQRIGSVLDYSKAKGWREAEAPMRAVNTLLRGIRQPKAKNFAAMPYRQLPAFMAKLESSSARVGRLALQFLILTAARSGEVRGATWAEIDLVHEVWNIPGSRMKIGEAHSVPLSASSVEVLKQMKTHWNGKAEAVVFPGLKRKPLSDMTLAKVLRAHGGAGYTVHGFRSAFRDWCAETGVPGDWAEAALAHTVANRVEAAYRRTKFLEQRQTLMAKWSDFLFTK